MIFQMNFSGNHCMINAVPVRKLSAFPAARARKSNAGAQRGMSGDRANLNVLLVEDDPNDERIMRGHLQRSKFFDCAIFCASDMASARHEATAREFDVMILDFWVRAEDSLSMLTQPSQHMFRAPAIVVSSLDMTDVQAQSLTAGAMAYLHKNDLSASAFDATLRTLLHARLKEDRMRRSLVQKEHEQERLRDETAEMAHEIMNTLNAVHGFAEIMTATGNNPVLRTAAQAYPGLIKDGSERLIAILQRYLSQIGTQNIVAELRYEQVCLIDVIDEAAKAMARRCAAKHQDIDIVATSDKLLAEVDRTAIYQMMVNLISNAHKYSVDGNPIRITVDDIGDQVRIGIIDQGIGMSEREILVALQRYARVVAPSELAASGHGLGLAVVTSIIDMHGGTLEIESAKDWGTTFTVRLPKRRPTLN